MAIEIGARLPGTPLTPPSMRVRTRRFVVLEQARSISFQVQISLGFAANRSTMRAERRTSSLDATDLCPSEQKGRLRRKKHPELSTSSTEFGVSASCSSNTLGLVAVATCRE